MAGRAKENLPGGSLKYLFVYLEICIFKCSCRIYNYITHYIYVYAYVYVYVSLMVWSYRYTYVYLYVYAYVCIELIN